MTDGSAARRWQRRFLIVGAGACILCAGGTIFDWRQFLHSYLFAYLAWLGFVLGSLGLWMMHNLTGGAWGFALRRVWESAARTMPFMTLLFLPIALGVNAIYPWAADDDHTKPNFLNVPFFLVRVAVYFSIWTGLALLLNRWSDAHDRTNDSVYANRAQAISGPGMVLLALTVSFAAVDWIMSLEPEWYSSIFGAVVGTSYLLAAMGFAVAVATWTQGVEPRDNWNDLGNLLFAFVMLWIYMAFSQYLLIWSGNLPEEITWYLHRTQGGWQWIGLALAIGYFALPFCILLSRDVKRDPDRLRVVACLIAGMSVIHNYWLIAPAFSPGRFTLHWLDLAAFVALGGLWLTQFLRRLDLRPALPITERSVKEASHA